MNSVLSSENKSIKRVFLMSREIVLLTCFKFNNQKAIVNKHKKGMKFKGGD